MDRDTPEDSATPETSKGDGRQRRIGIGEDWAATIVGLALLALALLGIIGKGMVP